MIAFVGEPIAPSARAQMDKAITLAIEPDERYRGRSPPGGHRTLRHRDAAGATAGRR